MLCIYGCCWWLWWWTWFTGGGGAGGLEKEKTHQKDSYTASPLAAACSGLTILATSFPITVGAGASAGAANGSSSVFSTITSTGGGRGAVSVVVVLLLLLVLMVVQAVELMEKVNLMVMVINHQFHLRVIMVVQGEL